MKPKFNIGDKVNFTHDNKKCYGIVQYRGQSITKDIWSSYKLKFDIYIKSLFSFVKNK